MLKVLEYSPLKFSRMDIIPTSLLIANSDTFSKIITNLANLSFSKKRFPTQFKSASVTPLPKGGSFHNASLSTCQDTDRYLT